MKRNSHLGWKVKYAPGTLSAKGFQGGRAVAEDKVETPGAPANIRLTPDRLAINADGQDVSVVTIAVVDAQGRVVPTASNLVQFALEGPSRILGVGNGDPSCHEPDVFLSKWPFHSSPVAGWKWHRISDPYKTDLPEVTTNCDDSAWPQWDVRNETGPLDQREHGVFRTRLTVSDKDLAADAVELCFGMIDEDGWAYINGRKVGESHDWQTAPVFNVKSALHPGENSIAVVVANYTGAGGVDKGVELRMQDAPILPVWQRSVFNGLAQIIVQSAKGAGQIQLRARAEGLTPGAVQILSRPCAPRAAMP
jgi:beta-galactosidase